MLSREAQPSLYNPEMTESNKNSNQNNKILQHFHQECYCKHAEAYQHLADKLVITG